MKQVDSAADARPPAATAWSAAQTGDAERMKELFSGFLAAMAIGILSHLRRAGAAVP